MTKQDSVMNAIIFSITSGKKKAGDTLFSKDYDLSPTQMGRVFKTLVEKEIVYRQKDNSYALTESCVHNAKEMYLLKIYNSISEMKILCNASNLKLKQETMDLIITDLMISVRGNANEN